MKKYLALGGCAAAVALLVFMFAPGSPMAGTRVGIPQYPDGIVVGDNYSEDTLWVMGHIKVDSTVSMGANLTVAYITVTDSMLVSTGKIFFSAGSSLYADSIHFNDNVHFAAGKKIYLGGGLTFTGGLVTLDSLEGNKLFRFDKGASVVGDSTLIFDKFIATFDSVRVGGKSEFSGVINTDTVHFGDDVFFPQGTRVYGDSNLIFSGFGATFDSTRIGGKALFNGDVTFGLGGTIQFDSLKGTQGAFIRVDSSFAVTGGYLVVDTIGGLSRTRLATDATFYGDSTIQFSGGRIQADSAVVGTRIRMNKDGTIAGDSAIVVSGAVFTADSARVTNVYASGVTATGRVTGARAEMDTLSVNNTEALIPMVFQVDSLGVDQTIAIWTWPRDYQVHKVQVNATTIVDDTCYLEILLDTLGGTQRESLLIGGTGKAMTFTPAAWLEADTEPCTLRTFLGSGTKGGLIANVILWLKLR